MAAVRLYTPEEYKARVREKERIRRTTPEYKAYQKAYHSRPDIQEAVRAHRSTPEYRALIKARRATQGYRIWARNYRRRVLDNDIQGRLAYNLRISMHKRIKRATRPGSAIRDLGCTLGEFKAYIEVQFLPGMNWNNWNQAGWHLDHIRPLASFDLTKREEFLQACHYTNYQPLWAVDNMRKGTKRP